METSTPSGEEMKQRNVRTSPFGNARRPRGEMRRVNVGTHFRSSCSIRFAFSGKVSVTGRPVAGFSNVKDVAVPE